MYIELHCHSNFSLLDGASHPEALVARAAELDMPALALTDHDAVYGVPRFIRAGRESGVRPILGVELTLTGDQHLTLLVEDEAGWHNLCYLISRARHGRPKGEALLPVGELVGCTDGLIALSGCRNGAIPAALLRDDREEALATGRRMIDLFGRENFWIELQRHHLPEDVWLVPRLAALAAYLNLGVVATNNVHYATPDGRMLRDVLVCIRHLTTLDEVGRDPERFTAHLNAEYHLKAAGQMAALFADLPEAIDNTHLLADRCRFDLEYGLQDLPDFPTPHGMSSAAYLRRLCEEGLAGRYSDPPSRARQQMAHELLVIERSRLANYFLIVWDIVRYARENDIRCQGRGSAANSLVAYLLYISPIDPLAHDLVFERFLSEERKAIPDIDIDFDAGRREEVIQYIYQRYGPEHTAMACTFVTFRSRSALRDIGKALGMPQETISEIRERMGDQRATPDPHSPLPPSHSPLPTPLLLSLARQIEGFPRHLGIHSGGMIITGPPMMGRAPTEPATMTDRVVIQWDKDGLEDAGLVKIDILGLRMLSAVTEAATMIGQMTGETPDLDRLTFDDPAVFEMIGRADTIGVFQVESRAQAQMLPKLKPHHFNDLVVGISLIRPGPIQGNMVHPFLRRRLGLEPVAYAHPLLEPALAETLGVILFQEQVLKVARDLAGFNPGLGEQLRRALGSKRAGEAIERFHDAFISGAEAKGVGSDVAETVFDQLRAFGGYSFAKSHAAAFSVLVYQSAWLKKYHFAAFYAALLNNQPMGFWNPAVLVNEIRRNGLRVLPVDINRSAPGCTVEEGTIRLGFNTVKSLREDLLGKIIAARDESPFTDLDDFYRRVRPGRVASENLIMAGAMDSWGVPRRQLVWELGAPHAQEGELELDFPADVVELPDLSPAEAMLAEQEVMGLSPGDQIMAFYRPWLNERGILDSVQLSRCPNDQRVLIAGLVVVHQSPPTAKGFHFVTLEDEGGLINVVVRPKVYERYRRTWRGSRLLLVEGDVQQEDGVTNLLARRVRAIG